jgi:hypothetical protein
LVLLSLNLGVPSFALSSAAAVRLVLDETVFCVLFSVLAGCYLLSLFRSVYRGSTFCIYVILVSLLMNGRGNSKPDPSSSRTE